MSDEKPPKPPKRPGPPAGLGTAGKALWKRIMGDIAPGWLLDERDLLVLAEAAATADTIAALDAAINEIGETVGAKMNPAVVERRQQRVALMRLLAAVDLDERQVGVTGSSRRAQKAANVRWDLEKRRGARRVA